MSANDRDELRMAREMQQALLPHHYPAFPAGVAPENSAVQFAHYFEPNGLVGGDLFDIFPMGQSRVGVFICDVMGHGVRAALGTGMILGMLQQLCEETRDPARVLTRINHRLSEILAYLPEGIFTTAFFMVLDTEDGSITYSNAGHPSPLIFKKTGPVEWLKTSHCTGTALALAGAHTFYQNAHARLNEGDRILLYTDGITEVQDANGQDFGEEALLRFAEQHRALSPQDFMEQLVTALRAFSGKEDFPDDTCMVWTEFDHYAI